MLQQQAKMQTDKLLLKLLQIMAEEPSSVPAECKLMQNLCQMMRNTNKIPWSVPSDAAAAYVSYTCAQMVLLIITLANSDL